MASGRLLVQCPECGTELAVDPATGAVLSSRQPKQAPAGGRSLEALLADLDHQKSRAEERFEQERKQLEDRERLLEEKFREAMRRADEEPDLPPRRPFDLD